MAVNVIMPKWGLTMKEGTITKWHKSEGDTIQKGEDFFEVETEKINNVVEALASGVVFQIVISAGTTVPVGTIVAVIAEPGEQPERIERIQVSQAIEEAASAPGRLAPTPAEKPPEKEFVPTTPAARRLAKELGVDLAFVEGTGPKGRITEADVRRFHEEGPPVPKVTPLAAEMIRQSGLDISTLTGTGEGGKITKVDVEHGLAGEKAAPVQSIPFAGMRRAIAEKMQNSLQNAAQLTMFTEVDVTESLQFLEQVRQEYKADESIRVSMNDIIVLATSRALKQHPSMNSNLVGDEILVFESVHMGIAVALPDGLIVPVLRDADKKDLLQIAREGRILAQKAREGTLGVDEVTGGTFTITNVSKFQVDGFTPILKPPETGILGAGRIKKKPAEYKGKVVLRSLMYLSLTFDHQVVDGALAGEFLETVVRYLEEPSLIIT